MRLTLTDQGHAGWSTLLWHALGLLLVLLGPTLLTLGQPYWVLPEASVPQVLVIAVGYVTAALFLALAMRALTRVWAVAALMIAGLGVSGPVFLFFQGVDLPFSRTTVLVGAALGASLALAPYVLPPRALRVGLIPLATLALAASVGAAMKGREVVALGIAETRRTSVHNIRITYHRDLIGLSPTAGGGGLANYGEDFIVANGAGEFRRLSWDDASLRSQELSLPQVLNRDAFLADNSLQSEAGFFRVMDVAVDTLAMPHRILASHYHWTPADRCVALRVSSIAMPGSQPGIEPTSWETVFTARPCIPWDGAAVELTNHAGGRMAWSSDGSLLVTVGDFLQNGRDGTDPFAQLPDNDYGKILLIDRSGGVQAYSIGHRNPEGLAVTPTAVWSTEHGPSGGDELNLITRGANYGWPFASYGTFGSSFIWPLSENHHDHGRYEEPVYSWVPSVGISQVIEVGGKQFPSWEGDLLAGSLTGESLFRMRIRSGRAVFIEQLPLARRIRDMVEATDGRIVIWTDRSELVSLTNAGADRTGEIVFSECAVCHGAAPGVPAVGPDLRGVYGRQAGRLGGYTFSEALRGLDVTWTTESLDRFLSSPAGFAPGTGMAVEGLSAEDRAAVIDFLRTYN